MTTISSFPKLLESSPRMEPKYLAMIRGMKKRGKREWNVYVLRCGDGTLYTGIAKDVQARLGAHQKGKGAAYTRTHLPVRLIYQENKLTRSKALIREAAIKRYPKSQKEKLVGVPTGEPSAWLAKTTPNPN